MKRGRPPIAAEHRCEEQFAFRATHSLADDIRQFAEYHGMSVPEITRHWWKKAIEKNPSFRVTEKRIS